MKHPLYVLRYAKRHQKVVTVKKIKPVAIIELHLSESISQSVENYSLKFYSKFLEAFCIALKALLGFVIPNQISMIPNIQYNCTV